MYRKGAASLLAITIGLMASACAIRSESCVPPFSGIISWWPCDVDAGDIQDGNNGVEMNGISPGVPGMVQGAFSLDGEDDYVEIPNAPNLNPASEITVAAWYHTTTFYGNGTAHQLDRSAVCQFLRCKACQR